MNTRLTHCSACDRDVRIVMPVEPVFEGHANLRDAEIVCLEIGDKCTGAMCPIGAAPPAVMAVRLIQSGFMPVMQPLIRARCGVCEEVTKFAVINTEYATCTECGATADRKRLALLTSN